MKEVNFNVGADAVVQLGENLYKTIYGVLIEYITNSYDADASYVEIKIDRTRKMIVIKDNGAGMTHDELETIFLNVGLNRRKAMNVTQKGRLVTGRKGFGKLACFGLFENFKVETVKNGLSSILEIAVEESEEEGVTYTAKINDQAEVTAESNGTTIYLINNSQKITDNDSLAESIAKRINIMYDGNETDPEGFIIKLEDIIIDKTFRDELVLNNDIKFKYNIPADLKRFTKEKDVIEYIEKNSINGVIIAREKTVRIKENKGVVLFARGKLCQEATYLNINPSNNYGYAHLYAELNVDFIDNDKKDNIGTDRTALKQTEVTLKLFEVIETLMKAYAKLYDEDEKLRKDFAIERFKEEDIYKSITRSIESIRDISVKTELHKLFKIRIKNSVTEDTIGTEDIENFEKVANSIISTLSISSDQISKDEPKDNITTSYDYALTYLRDKYGYVGADGSVAIEQIYSHASRYADFTLLAACLTDETRGEIKSSMRELGKAMVNLRNSIVHTNNRACINENISIENSKRFLVMVDLFTELDNLFFTNINI